MNIFDLIVVQPIFNLLIGIYSLIPGGDFGVSLIIFTIIVRLLLWPLVKKQLHQARAMRKMQPELKKLRAKHKNNRQAQGLAMMELYKKHNISPFRSIGILFIQLPILIGVYSVVRIFVMNRDKIEHFAYPFMQQIDSVKQLITHPDTFNEYLFNSIDLTQHAISSDGVNIFLLLLAAAASVLQFFMAKQTSPTGDSNRRMRDVLSEAAAGKEADQSEINAIVTRKMMKLLPIFLFVIMVSLPGALALYMAVSNGVAFLQQWYILRQDEEELTTIAKEGDKKQPKKTAVNTRAKKAKEATVVSETKKTPTKKATTPAKKPSPKKSKKATLSSSVNVTRITARDKGRKG